MPQPIEGARLHQVIVLYGPSGAGKTTLAATAPKPLIADSNNGTLSIAGRRGFEHVRREPVSKTAHLERIYKNCRGTGTKDWSKLYQTIVYDHFDDIQQLVLDELNDKALEKDSRRDPDEVQQKEWGTMRRRLGRYLRRMRELPMHKILICGEMESKEDARLTPSLQGGLKTDLPYLVDHTLYLRIGKKNSRWLHLDSTDDFYAKTRAWWLPAELRKQAVRFDDPKFLTRFLAMIAAGPKKRVLHHGSNTPNED